MLDILNFGQIILNLVDFKNNFKALFKFLSGIEMMISKTTYPTSKMIVGDTIYLIKSLRVPKFNFIPIFKLETTIFDMCGHPSIMTITTIETFFSFKSPFCIYLDWLCEIRKCNITDHARSMCRWNKISIQKYADSFTFDW